MRFPMTTDLKRVLVPTTAAETVDAIVALAGWICDDAAGGPKGRKQAHYVSTLLTYVLEMVAVLDTALAENGLEREHASGLRECLRHAWLATRVRREENNLPTPERLIPFAYRLTSSGRPQTSVWDGLKAQPRSKPDAQPHKAPRPPAAAVRPSGMRSAPPGTASPVVDGGSVPAEAENRPGTQRPDSGA